MMLSRLMIVFLFSQSLLAFEVFDAKSGRSLDKEEFYALFSPGDLIVLGEEHYSEAIQSLEAQLIGRYNSTVFWEFLDYTDQEKIVEQYSLFLQGQLSASDLLREIGLNNAPTYEQVLLAMKVKNSSLVGVNLPRSIKRVVTQGGLAQLDPKYIPSIYADGSIYYQERFYEIMQGHVSADKLYNYFQAQSLTDAVMAEQIINGHDAQKLSFLIVGNFHSEYSLGVVEFLKKYYPQKVWNMRLFSSKQELEERLKPHPQYGEVSDFLIVQ